MEDQVDAVDKEAIKKHQNEIERIRKEVSRIVVGQEEVVTGLIRGLFSKGHVLVEGVPGIAKTLLIRSLAVTTGCSFSRVQFTVDLLPSDIVGITTYNEKKGFYTMKGPIFANFVLADEVNRAPSKTQSALLEAMQEKQATIGRTTYSIGEPFFVMASQNPIESAGVYPLPEAQIDRFLFKLYMGYPTQDEEEEILMTNISLKRFEDYNIKPIITRKKLIEMQDATHKIYLSTPVKKYIVKIVNATRNPDEYKLKLGHYIGYGASPRASIGLFIASKANALISGRNFVLPDDVKKVAFDVLRHRILLNYEGEAENIKTEKIIQEVLNKVKEP